MTDLPIDADADRRARLVRMKLLAAALLIAMAVVFVVCWLLQDAHPWLGYVRAAAEAGMVGALADWFAVTALFRHPLGVPIPHTAIIPRRKDAIGSALSDFVASNFLSEDVVRDKLARMNIARRLGGWLSRRENAERVTSELASAVRGLTQVLSDEQIAAALAGLLRDRVAAGHVGPPLGRVLAEVFRRGDHRPLVDFVIDRCASWIRDNQATITSIVTTRAPGWSPRFVDGIVAGRVYREVDTFARAVQTNKNHPVRLALDAFGERFARDLQSDPATIARADEVAGRIAGNAQVQILAAGLWDGAKRALADAAHDPDSPLRRTVAGGLVSLGKRLLDDPALAARIDGWIADAAGYVAARHARSITGIIDDTIARWDGAQTARTIELHVGRDLQFIRINGTVVGALAGLAIYTVAQLLLG